MPLTRQRGRAWAEDGGEFVRLSIRDTGSGMPAHVAERAFEPFFTTKVVGKGTGLGLSQIHGFAAQAGGRAEIHSSEGAGTTVRMLLPASCKPLSAAAKGPQLAELPSGLRVLLVEDNEQVLQFAEGLLADLGCAVACAAGASEALEILAGGGIDLVLSDVVMPEVSGVELARAVRESHPDVPVLLATGYSDEIALGRSEFAVISKPFGAADLSKAIAGVLSGSRDEAA